MIALNRPIGVELAEALHKNFVEVLIAPGFEDGALEILQQKEASGSSATRSAGGPIPANATSNGFAAAC